MTYPAPSASKDDPAPVAVFAFARPDHLRRTIESLRANAEAARTHVTFYCDGSRAETDRPQVEAVRDYIASVAGFASVAVVTQSRNLGLAASIILGVTQMLKQHESVIVVEDDLLLSSHFLRYMNEALAHYRDDDRVASIHGYSFPTRAPLPETYFLKGADCWGWATWRRAWPGFNPDGRALLAALESRRLTHDFDLDGSYPYTEMLRNQIRGRNSSWAIRWHASCYLADRLTLYPGQSLVENIGNDSSGTHSATTSVYNGAISNSPVRIGGIPVEPSAEARSAIIDFLAPQRGWKSGLRGLLHTLTGVSR